MLVLIFGFVLFFFLAVGAVVFVICLTIAPLKRFALSAALWCALWGPCTIAWMLFAGMVGFAGSYGLEHVDASRLHLAEWRKGLGMGLLSLAVVTTAVVATAVAWLHQIIVRRMTFALFRVYAAVIAAGVGSVWGWSLGLAMVAYEVPHRLPLWLATMVAFSGGFGYLAYRGARGLRGEAPEQFGWVTREEFEGQVEEG